MRDFFIHAPIFYQLYYTRGQRQGEHLFGRCASMDGFIYL